MDQRLTRDQRLAATAAEMGSAAPASAEDAVKAAILANPDLVLGDPELMRALIEPATREGRNVVDLRGALIERLERRLSKLAEAHRDVIAATWESINDMGQAHRAVLRLLDAKSFDDFLEALSGETPLILEAHCIRVCVEAPGAVRLRTPLVSLEPGSLSTVAPPRAADRPGAILRGGLPCGSFVFGSEAPRIRSEAVATLDLGDAFGPGVIAIGSRDRDRFNDRHGTEVFVFLADIVQRALRAWLNPRG